MLKDPNVMLPRNIVSLFQKLMNLPPSLFWSYGIHSKDRKTLADGSFLIGKPSFRILTDEEKSVMMQWFPTSDLSNSTRLFDFGNALKSVASLYPKLELKNGTIFTTSSYARFHFYSN